MEYVASACDTGTFNTSGANTLTRFCSLLDPNYLLFLLSECVQGNRTDAGLDAWIVDCDEMAVLGKESIDFEKMWWRECYISPWIPTIGIVGFAFLFAVYKLIRKYQLSKQFVLESANRRGSYFRVDTDKVTLGAPKTLETLDAFKKDCIWKKTNLSSPMHCYIRSNFHKKIVGVRVAARLCPWTPGISVKAEGCVVALHLIHRGFRQLTPVLLCALQVSEKSSLIMQDPPKGKVIDLQAAFNIVPALNGYSGAVSFEIDGRYMMHLGNELATGEVPTSSVPALNAFKDDSSFLITRWPEVRSKAIKRFNKGKPPRNNCFTRLRDKAKAAAAKAGLVEEDAPADDKLKMGRKRPGAAGGADAKNEVKEKNKQKKEKEKHGGSSKKHHHHAKKHSPTKSKKAVRVEDKYAVEDGSADELSPPVTPFSGAGGSDSAGSGENANSLFFLCLSLRFHGAGCWISLPFVH